MIELKKTSIPPAWQEESTHRKIRSLCPRERGGDRERERERQRGIDRETERQRQREKQNNRQRVHVKKSRKILHRRSN